MSNRYRKLSFFWMVLLAFSLVFMALNWRGLGWIEPGRPSENGDPGAPPGNVIPTEPGVTDPPLGVIDGQDPARTFNLFVGLLTAVTSTGGLFVTTFFALRDDRRSSARHALELRKLEQELTQRELEIERLRRENAAQSKVE